MNSCRNASRTAAGVVLIAAAMSACGAGSSSAPAAKGSTTPANLRSVVQQEVPATSVSLAASASASVPLVQQIHAAAMGLASKSSGLPATTFTGSIAALRPRLLEIAVRTKRGATGLDRQLSTELDTYARIAARLVQQARPLSASQTAQLSIADQQWLRTVAVIGKKTRMNALEHVPAMPLPAPPPPKTGKH